MVSGLSGYESKVKRCTEKGKPMNRSTALSAPSRRKKKLIAKSAWFRSKTNDVQEEERIPTGRKQKECVWKVNH